MLLHILMAVTVSICRPWTKHISLCIFLIWDGFSFSLGDAITLFHESVLPRLVISSNHMESLFLPPALQTYTVSLFVAMVIMSRDFVQGKLTLIWPFCGVSWLIIQASPVLSVSCTITSDVWSYAHAGLRRSPLTSCQRVCLLSTMTYCFESKTRAAPWPYLDRKSVV